MCFMGRGELDYLTKPPDYSFLRSEASRVHLLYCHDDYWAPLWVKVPPPPPPSRGPNKGSPAPHLPGDRSRFGGIDCHRMNGICRDPEFVGIWGDVCRDLGRFEGDLRGN